MTTSTNYGLKKPDYNDQYDLADWNYNTDKIDQTMKNISDGLTTETTNRQNAVSDEATARGNADTALGGRIDDVVNGNTTVAKATKAYQDEDGNNIKSSYQKSNLVTSWQSTTDNTHYPSEKLVKDGLDGKASSSHTHSVSDVSGLQSTLNSLSSAIGGKISSAYIAQSHNVSSIDNTNPTIITLDTMNFNVLTLIVLTLNPIGYTEESYHHYAQILLPNQNGKFLVLRSVGTNVGGTPDSGSYVTIRSKNEIAAFPSFTSQKVVSLAILRVDV